MALEIRPLRDDEVEQAEFIRSYAFNTPERPDLTASVERARKFFPLDWSLGAFEDGVMTSWLRVVPFAMRINGRALSFGGVGPVVALPEHRRKGHVGALLRRALSDMRDRGQVLSGLHTPHPSLYRRYGWEIASFRRAFAFAPKDIALKVQPSARGRVRMLTADDWPQADRVYRHYAARRNGPLHRGEVWWREAVLPQNDQLFADAALWENDAGDAQGYVVYQQRRAPGSDMPPFWVRELVALSSDAYLNLILYLLRHDLAGEIVLNAPVDDPFLSVVDDAHRVKVADDYDVMLRICDVEAALRQRAPAQVERAIELTLQIEDASAPWNEGCYRVSIGEGGAELERTDRQPDLSLSATTLAPIFNGFLSVSGAALAGLVRAKSEDALGAGDAFFATLYPPFCADGF